MPTLSQQQQHNRHRQHPLKDRRQRHLADLRRQRTTRGGPAERVRVSDVPATGRGRAYLIERELEKDGYAALKALVADYLHQAQLHGVVPMRAPADRWIEHLDDTDAAD